LSADPLTAHRPGLLIDSENGLLYVMKFSVAAALCLAACARSVTINPDAGMSCDSPRPLTCTGQHYDDVKPLFTRYCVPCHWGDPTGPWPLTAYEDIEAW